MAARSALSKWSRVNHIGIRVANVEKTRAFYEKLGFVWVVGPVGPEPVAVMEHENKTTLNLILNGKEHEREGGNVLMDVPEKRAGYTHMALETDNIDALAKDLEAEGIEITGRMTLPGEGKSLFVRDPDWTTIEFHQPGQKWHPTLAEVKAGAPTTMVGDKTEVKQE